ncbi:hypothetical protein BDP81DRAFT_428649, partial [Colletotrichum phormii]
MVPCRSRLFSLWFLRQEPIDDDRGSLSADFLERGFRLIVRSFADIFACFSETFGLGRECACTWATLRSSRVPIAIRGSQWVNSHYRDYFDANLPGLPRDFCVEAQEVKIISRLAKANVRSLMEHRVPSLSHYTQMFPPLLSARDRELVPSVPRLTSPLPLYL